MTLQVYSPQPSRFRLRMVYSVSSLWVSKAPAWSSRFDSSHSNRSTRDGWALSTLQVITTGLPRPWRISMKTGSTVGGSEQTDRSFQLTFNQDRKVCQEYYHENREWWDGGGVDIYTRPVLFKFGLSYVWSPLRLIIEKRYLQDKNSYRNNKKYQVWDLCTLSASSKQSAMQKFQKQNTRLKPFWGGWRYAWKDRFCGKTNPSVKGWWGAKKAFITGN